MQRMLRNPLIWMVAGECVIVTALVLVAWHMLVTRPAPDVAAPFVAPPAATPGDGALPEGSRVLPATPNPRGPSPGLNLDVGFWHLRLGALNRDTAAVESLEWKITHAVMAAVRGYMDTVVLPAIRRAEVGGG